MQHMNVLNGDIGHYSENAVNLHSEQLQICNLATVGGIQTV